MTDSPRPQAHAPLTRSPRTAPQRRIVDFERDLNETPRPGHQVWVAQLECGHTQHFRHQPPMNSVPWLLDEAQRQAKIGSQVACQACLMPSLPEGARLIRRTPSWRTHEIPKALLSTHDLRADRWGRLIVEEGRLSYLLDDVSPPECFHLKPGLPGIIEPLRPHHIEAQGEVQIYIEFYAVDSNV